MKVRIYRNLHKKCFSVQSKVDGKWKVVDHTNYIMLKDVTFKVSEAGRQRVLRERKKNVHAYILGEVVGSNKSLAGRVFKEIAYNPYNGPRFGYLYGESLVDGFDKVKEAVIIGTKLYEVV